MKEIKFRAWDIERQAMFQVNEITFDMQFECGWSFMKAYPLDDWNRQVARDWKYDNFGSKDPQTILMQYTGLKDKNGKDIYEKDIVYRFCGDPNCAQDHIGEVFYSTHWGMYMITENRQDLRRALGEYYPPLAFGNIDNGLLMPIEIKGNSYENPELLVKQN